MVGRRAFEMPAELYYFRIPLFFFFFSLIAELITKIAEERELQGFGSQPLVTDDFYKPSSKQIVLSYPQKENIKICDDLKCCAWQSKNLLLAGALWEQ